MILKKIQLKPDTTDSEYAEFCNLCEKQGIFRACGSCDDKWIIVQFEDEVDMAAWLVSRVTCS